MKFILDENLPPTLARGLAAFGEPVEYVTDHLPAGTTDEKILEFVGSNGFFLITRDNRIRYNPPEIALIRQSKVGAFILRGKSSSGWDLVRQLVRNWHRIKEISAQKRTPFIYQIPSAGTKITRLPF